jgi:hypothetical protein
MLGEETLTLTIDKIMRDEGGFKMGPSSLWI